MILTQSPEIWTMDLTPKSSVQSCIDGFMRTHQYMALVTYGCRFIYSYSFTSTILIIGDGFVYYLQKRLQIYVLRLVIKLVLPVVLQTN